MIMFTVVQQRLCLGLGIQFSHKLARFQNSITGHQVYTIRRQKGEQRQEKESGLSKVTGPKKVFPTSRKRPGEAAFFSERASAEIPGYFVTFE